MLFVEFIQFLINSISNCLTLQHFVRVPYVYPNNRSVG